MAAKAKPARGGGTPYESDVVTWAERRAEALRAGRFAELDLENLAEEIADVSRREAEGLETRLETLVMHLLWRHDPGHRSRSREGTMRVARPKTAKLLHDGPSFRPQPPALLDDERDRSTTCAGRTSHHEQASSPSAFALGAGAAGMGSAIA